MANRRLSVSLRDGHAIEATRVSIGDQRLAYVLIAERPKSYPFGRSRIVYIGTTKTGAARIASSVAARADDILGSHGVRKFHARVVTCTPRQKVKTWRKLERALLLEFRAKFGAVPECNTQGAQIAEDDEFEYFTRERIRSLIDELS